MHACPAYPTEMTRQSSDGWSLWHVIGSVAVAGALGLILLSPPAVQARTFQCRAGDVACLIASIRQANAQPGPRHEIRLAAGVYTLTAVENETDGPNGLPSITSQLTIRGAGEDVTVIERNGQNPILFRLLHVAATGVLTLQGLALSGGQAESNPAAFGGALYNHGGTVTITNSTLAHNVASGGNAGWGGAIYTEGGRVTISSTTLTDNQAYAADGGGYGGALYNHGGTVTITTSTFAQNVAHSWDYGFGGGLLSSGGTVTIRNSTFAYNRAEPALYTLGGGLYTHGGTVTIANTTFAHNVADGGQIEGGGGALSISGGTITITNSTLAENVARLFAESSGGGGGLYNRGGTVALQNTILARNTVDIHMEPWCEPDCFGINVGGPECLGPVTSRGHNLIGDPADCTITLQDGADLTGEPGLAAFSESETPGYGHFPLLQGSRAINAASPAVCPRTDQLGQPRVEVCDIGSIEFQGTAVSSQ